MTWSLEGGRAVCDARGEGDYGRREGGLFVMLGERVITEGGRGDCCDADLIAEDSELRLLRGVGENTALCHTI